MVHLQMIKIMIYLLQMVIFHGYAKPKGIRIFPRISHDIPPKKKRSSSWVHSWKKSHDSTTSSAALLVPAANICAISWCIS